MKITFISDTHNKQKQLHLPGGDVVICAGDISSMGYEHEIKNFLKWYNKLPYTYKILVAGNHDFFFQDNPSKIQELLKEYDVIYLEDDFVYIGEHPNLVKIYGSPYQPKFLNWAFNIERNSQEMVDKWNQIPADTDILITHGPVFGYLDTMIGDNSHKGCEILRERIDLIKPKIHVCGHVHSGYGYTTNGNTHFFNASVLNEQYNYANQPLTIEWNKENNDVIWE